MTIDEIVEAARREAATAVSWADFSNFLFDPEEGLLPGLFPTQAERRQFMKSAEYAELRQMSEEVKERVGLIEGATPVKTAYVVDRLPQHIRDAIINDDR
jgi:hypothetical protein